MYEEILNSNESQEVVVEPQIDVVEESVKDSQVADVKPVQSAELNSQYAEIRRSTEQKTKDAMIAEMYGESHGIKTYADYQKAMSEQQKEAERAQIQEETGIDPDTLQNTFEKLKENDPDFQELKAIRAEKNTTTQLTDLNSELKDCGIDLQLKDLSATEVAKIPNVDKVIELASKGKTLAEAVFLANKKEFFAKQAATAQQDTIKKIAANGASSPGSLGSGNDNSPGDMWSMSDKDFKAMQEKALRGDLRK